MRKIYGVLFLLFPLALKAQTNEGTDFYLAFMQHVDVGNNAMVVMITSKYATAGVVEMPLQNWSQAFSVAANQVTVVRLPGTAETIGSETRQTNGIRVRSNLPVSVYMHQYHSMRSEASVVLPVNSLGSMYYAITYRGYNQNGTVHPSEFIVVGVEADTEVRIRLSDATQGGRKAGDQLLARLNPGETFQVQAQSAQGDLTGTLVESDKPFALFAGASWTEVPSGCSARDNLLEQMYPVSTWGKQFVTVPNAETDFDVFRILASENQTVALVQGQATDTVRLNAGAFYEYRKSEATYISSNKPVAVMQYNVGSGCSGHRVGDPSMVFLNSLEQIRDTVTLYNSTFEAITENYINLISLTADTAFITIDGKPLNSPGTVINTIGPGNSFAYARLPVASGAHTLISSGCGIIATAYGYGNVESYAYSGGASFRPINANPIPEGGCLNDTVFFDTGLRPPRFSSVWDFGNGDTVQAQKFFRAFHRLGTFPVQLTITDHCLDRKETLSKSLEITLRKALETTGDVLACQGETVHLGATDLPGARYEWTGPNGYFSSEQLPHLAGIRPEDAGTYLVTGNVSGCATFPAEAKVEVVPAPTPDLGPDTLICPDLEGFSMQLFPGDFAAYRWQDGSAEPFFDVLEEGTFTVQVWDSHGCTAGDTLTLYQRCPTKWFVPNAFSPNGDGVNDAFRVFGEDILSLDLRVYDRWGTLLFQTNDPSQGWDGRYKGEALNSGVFLWKAAIEGYRRNGKKFTEILSGDVALIR